MKLGSPSERLSARFAVFAHIGEGERLSLGQVLDALGDRGHALVSLLLVAPFLQPVPLPGISTLFGLVIAVVGGQMLLARPPWLPRRLREREVARALLVRFGAAAEHLLSKVEHVIAPRAPFFHATPLARRLAGGVIIVAAILLSMPLPVPVSNFLPALTIALVALGSAEEDGLVVALGYVSLLVTLAFFAALVLLPLLGLESLTN